MTPGKRQRHAYIPSRPWAILGRLLPPFPTSMIANF